MASEGMHSPVEQFEIKPIIELAAGGYDISFTNSSLFMLLAMVVGGVFLASAMSKREMVPGRMQGAAEMMYEFVADMVRSNVGNDGRAYFPFVFTLFVFLLVGNMLGLIPYSYTFTSQIIVTFAMAAFVFVGVTLIGLFKHGLHFFSFFVPQGAPKVLIPFLIIIEVISYFVRPVSLSVRLFANMLAGHTMLKVFAGLAVMISGAGGFAMAGSVLPLLALIGLRLAPFFPFSAGNYLLGGTTSVPLRSFLAATLLGCLLSNFVSVSLGAAAGGAAAAVLSDGGS